MPRLLYALILAAGALRTETASAQGPCAEAAIAVIGTSHAPLPGVTVAFHSVVHRVGTDGRAVADSVVSQARYVGRTNARGVYTRQGAGVGEYVVRVRGRSGAAGEARLYCASASRSRVYVELAESAD